MLFKIQLLICWAHVRRDFLSLGKLYHLNNSRLEVVDKPEFAERDNKLREALDEMGQKMETERQDENTHHACKKVLDSLDNHWDGLTVFVDHPELPMDNNKALSSFLENPQDLLKVA